MSGEDALPVPAALETQLSKCKTVRSSDYYKPRTKTAEVSVDESQKNVICCVKKVGPGKI